MSTRYACKTCGAESVAGVGYVVCCDTYRFPAPHPSCEQFHKGYEKAFDRYLAGQAAPSTRAQGSSVVAWNIAGSGVRFPASSVYVEMVWAGLLGPTATLLYRRLSVYAELTGGASVDLDEVAAGLGVARKVLDRAFSRLARFGFISLETGSIRCRREVGAVPAHQLDRLGRLARRYHDSVTAMAHVDEPAA